jgi:tetratricopeptide (TPR) repeat protein
MSSASLRFGLGSLAAGLVLALARPSSAEDPEESSVAVPGSPIAIQPSDAPPTSIQPSAEELNEEGARLFEAGSYRLAVERFIEAYALEKDSNLLFNIASCYERLGDPGAAIEKYREFLASPDAAAEGRAPADAAIQRLQAQANAAAPSPPLTEADGAPAPALAMPDASPEGSGSLATLRWATLGTGVVFSSLGIAFYWMGSRDHDRVTDAPGHADQNAVSGLSREQAQELVDSGSSKKAVGAAGLALGGTMLAAYGVWTLLRAYEDDAEASAPSVALAPSSRGGAVTISGRF